MMTTINDDIDATNDDDQDDAQDDAHDDHDSGSGQSHSQFASRLIQSAHSLSWLSLFSI